MGSPQCALCTRDVLVVPAMYSHRAWCTCNGRVQGGLTTEHMPVMFCRRPITATDTSALGRKPFMKSIASTIHLHHQNSMHRNSHAL